MFLRLALLCAIPVYAQTADIDKLDAQWGKAIVAHDAATLEKLLADDLIYGHASGVLDTKKTYIAKIASGKQVYATFERKNAIVRILDANTAVTHSWTHVTGVNPGGKFDDKLMMLHVWTKRNGA